MAPEIIRTEPVRIDAGFGDPHMPAGGRPAAIGKIFVTFGAAVQAWAERRRQRRALETLDDNMLHDIGLSRADVESEAAKPFWMI